MPRIFSGIQPSGELHIGNYLGAVRNWVQLQHEIESFICIVDYHAITQPYEPEDLRRRTYEMGVSLMAAGIDPAKATLFIQSRVPEHTELRGSSTRSHRLVSSSARRNSRTSRAGRSPSWRAS